MGGAIARGIASSADSRIRLTVSDPSKEKLSELSAEFPTIRTEADNSKAVSDADLVIVAVKPWILPLVAENLKDAALPRCIVSIVAGAGTDRLSELFGDNHAFFYVIPNTALMAGKGMTFITTRNADADETEAVKAIFATMGQVAVIEERLIPAATALCSCGIAYVYKYIQACTQAGVQMGFRPDEARAYSMATVEGAIAMLQRPGATPQEEIDRVTTPGGMTIKGVNSLEQTGFTASVINAIIEPLKH